jgi:hypothetical protein
MCEVICERGACCFASKGCASADIKCEDYATCARLYGDSQDDDIKGGTTATNSNQSGQQQTETPRSESNGGSDSDGGTNANDDLADGIVFKADVDDACFRL